ncbi:copper homeostasis protein [Lacibacter cauensis]|uniref:PF03932 family protein CutC n=1 Tax=Lacibacter cauensis TaxID=510947 RepID=A0A562SW32_9BACT|nr:copper homeostasis protein CutC [Lacibacter cauensis]TWI85006.1 copper homeostasis protein [Lacibacter cauensis]
MKRQLEVCAFTIQSCMIAEQAGAVRVELCDNPIEGGTTPSYGTIKRVREAVSIDVYPIIRPRSMNYFYDADEWNIVLDDIAVCKELGCNGVSVGAQLQNGTIDAARMQRVVELAYPMKVTCNRAFDAVPDPFAALETLIACGCERILTSGLASSAPEGIPLLKQLVAAANNRISIMPGAGVRSSNVLQLANETGAYEFHASARKAVNNPMTFENPNVTDAGNMYVADADELKKIVSLLQQA